MAINIKDKETEHLVRSIGKLTGRGITETIKLGMLALHKSLSASKDSATQRRSRIAAIREQTARLPVLDNRSADEILGYDDSGSAS